jgi:hypothetical protein
VPPPGRKILENFLESSRSTIRSKDQGSPPLFVLKQFFMLRLTVNTHYLAYRYLNNT